ncbi:hypothetical protein J4405_05275 [Candidatus Woesearchaeota archaeon]|nr:hypothetical protein [Candidatus Woesearchaeota archaeon]
MVDKVVYRTGCLMSIAGVAALVALFRVGPIDLTRTVYNQIIGDGTVLKRELLNYSRRDIQRKAPGYTPAQIDSLLAPELNAKIQDERINPLEISMENLWDASEEHARTGWERWMWPSLDYSNSNSSWEPLTQ